MRFVVDTNVLISALLKPGSVPDRLLAAIAESGTVLFDVRITDEYAAVLGRPKFGAIDRGRVASLLAALRAKGEELGDIPPWNGAMTDSDDRIFIEAALAGRADAVITGNIRHYPSNLGFDVLPPATLLARLGH